MDEKLLELITSAGGQTTVVGGLLLVFFYLRKAESGMRSEINNSLVRLQADKQELQEQIDKMEEDSRNREILFDTLREERRAAQDAQHDALRQKHDAEVRAEKAEAELERLRQIGNNNGG